MSRRRSHRVFEIVVIATLTALSTSVLTALAKDEATPSPPTVEEQAYKVMCPRLKLLVVEAQDKFEKLRGKKEGDDEYEGKLPIFKDWPCSIDLSEDHASYVCARPAVYRDPKVAAQQADKLYADLIKIAARCFAGGELRDKRTSNSERCSSRTIFSHSEGAALVISRCIEPDEKLGPVHMVYLTVHSRQ